MMEQRYKKLNLDEIKQNLLLIMDEIHEICQNNGLQYFLSGGTLLGAIRHQGFIPWDDDIDIYMPRQDYEKFIELYPKIGKNRLTAFELDPDYRYPFAKLNKVGTILVEENADCGVELGVYVDIFPLDGMGQTVKDAKQLMRKLKIWQTLGLSTRVKQWRKTEPFWRNLAIYCVNRIALLFGGHRKLNRKTTKIATTYRYEDSAHVGEFVDDIGDNRIWEKEWFQETVPHAFEDREYWIPNGYHQILSKFYGDYMTPPPEDKRVAHVFEAYEVEASK